MGLEFLPVVDCLWLWLLGVATIWLDVVDCWMLIVLMQVVLCYSICGLFGVWCLLRL